MTCKLQRQSASGQKMADLPIDRVSTDLPPFTHVGMDYFRPIEVKMGRGMMKRYGVLFTCLACLALEVAYNLDTDACVTHHRGMVNVRPPVVRFF